MFPTLLRSFAIIIAGVTALHVGLGLTADQWLGALPLADPVRDSQARFYGAMFIVPAWWLWQAAAHPALRRQALPPVLLAFELGALARGFALAASGWPGTWIAALWLIEAIAPVGVWVAWRSQEAAAPSVG